MKFQVVKLEELKPGDLFKITRGGDGFGIYTSDNYCFAIGDSKTILIFISVFRKNDVAAYRVFYQNKVCYVYFF